MAETLPRHLLIGFIIFTLIVAGGATMLSELAQTKPTFTDDDAFRDFNQSFHKLDVLRENTEALESNASATANEQSGDFGFLDALVGKSWNTLTQLGNSIGFIKDSLDGTSKIFGIPSWIPALIGLIITVVLVFAIFSAIFQRDV